MRIFTSLVLATGRLSISRGQNINNNNNIIIIIINIIIPLHFLIRNGPFTEEYTNIANNDDNNFRFSYVCHNSTHCSVLDACLLLSKMDANNHY